MRPISLSLVLAVACGFASSGCSTPRPPISTSGPTVYQGGVDPHGSLRAFTSTHFSPAAWRRSVAVGLFESKEIFVPVAIGAAALVVAPKDLRGSNAIFDSLGQRSAIGDVGVYTLVGSSVGLGLLRPRGDRSKRDEAWVQGEAFALTLGTTLALKTVVGRVRPRGSSDTGSFPSGHTSAAFCAATLISREQGPAFGVPAFALAALVGFSRIEAGRHYPSDVVAGAGIGTLSALVIDSLHFGAGKQTGICSPAPSVSASVTDDGRPCVGLELDL